jgi:hypothetical protein
MFHSRSRSILSGLVAGTGVCLALVSAPVPASAVIKPPDPQPTVRSGSVPGDDHTYPYSEYDPRSNVPPSLQSSTIDPTSVTLGALGGIALGGVGLGITLGMQRRRTHSALHSA